MWLIGVDDTDVLGSRGTGRLARMVAAELESRGLQSCGVTRHQLLVHPAIPYTSHNSANCVAVMGDVGDADAAFESLCRFVAADCPEGSDPGVCLVRSDRVAPAVMAFGRKAQREVLRREDAEETAAREHCLLAGLAGTRGGVIGALAAVGLRAEGEDGRFLDLGRIRDLTGAVRVQELLDAGVASVRGRDGATPDPGDLVETLDWVRPRLLGGRPVLLIERSADHGADWVVADRRHDSREPS